MSRGEFLSSAFEVDSRFNDRFERAVADLAQLLNLRGHLRRYLADPARIEEAAAVTPCVDRVIEYELWPPTHGKGVGRYGPVSLSPPLGQLLGPKRINSLDADQFETLVASVTDALAIGYASMTGVESDGSGFTPTSDVVASDVWKLWVVRLHSDDLDRLGIPEDVQSGIRNMASAQLTGGLKTLKLLPRMRKRMRLGVLGQLYGKAGMMLRLVQSTFGQIDPSEDLWQLTNQWPFERAD